MKPQTILILSLVGNLSLGAAAYHFLKAKRDVVPEDVAAKNVSPAAGKTKSTSATADAARQQVVTRFTAREFTWHNIEAQDYKDYIVNLRGVECPEETIRDIIVADVNKLYAARFKELRGPDAQENKYWKSEPFNSQTKEGYELQKKYRELEKEKSELLVQLLGVDPSKERNREMGYLDYMERNYSFLSEDKRDKVKQTQEKYELQKQELYRRGIVDEEDQQELRKIQKAQMAEMAQFLTPQELEEYELRASQTANSLRHELDGFEPSENEFRDIYKVKKTREDELSTYVYDPDDKEAQERRKKIGEEVDLQIKAQLGEERYADYKLAQDWSYKELTRLADRVGLPKETAKSVFDMKKVAEDAVKKIRDDKALTNEQRTQALQAIREETEKTIIASLGGEKNYNRYKSRGGYWVSNLAPTPRPSTTTTTTK